MSAFTQRPRVRWLPFALLALFALCSCTCVLKEHETRAGALQRDIFSPYLEFPNKVTGWYWLTPRNVDRLASGIRVTPNSRVAAHRELPMKSWIKIRNPENKRELLVQVLDRGPYVVGRDLDLSQAAFEELAPLSEGLIKYEILEVWIPNQK